MTNPDSGNISSTAFSPTVPDEHDTMDGEDLLMESEFCAGISCTDSMSVNDVDFDLEQLLTRVIEDEDPTLAVTMEQDLEILQEPTARFSCGCEYECTCKSNVIEFKPGKERVAKSQDLEDLVARAAAAEVSEIHYTQILAAAKEKLAEQPVVQFKTAKEDTWTRKPQKLIKGDDHAVMKHRLVQIRRRKIRREQTGERVIDFWTVARFRSNALHRGERETAKGLARWFGAKDSGASVEKKLERYIQQSTEAMAKQSNTWAGTYYFDAGMSQAYGY